MGRQTLPFDILLLILEVSPRPTAAKMMRMCHTLRKGGARFLLDGGLLLTTRDSIVSFLQFLNADAANRFQFLRTLELACGEIPPPAVVALLQLFSHPLLALDSLTLQDSEADSMLKSTPSSSSDVVYDAFNQPPLIAAIAGLTTIRHLTVHDNPLGRSLRVDELQNRNPIVLLANHSATLEEILGSHFAMLPGPDVYDTVYPLVRTINATFSDLLPPRTITYVAAFPSLTHLSLTPAGGSSRVGYDTSPRLQRALHLRLWNREIQENHIPRQTWKNLEELEGSVADILALGITCHVPKLRLAGSILSKPQEYEHVKTVLEDTRPVALAITIAGAPTFDDALGTVFREPSAQQLRRLEVELCFSPSEGDIDIQTVTTWPRRSPPPRSTTSLPPSTMASLPQQTNRIDLDTTGSVL